MRYMSSNKEERAGKKRIGYRMEHTRWTETILRQLSPVAWISTMLTTYMLDVAFSSVQVM